MALLAVRFCGCVLGLTGVAAIGTADLGQAQASQQINGASALASQDAQRYSSLQVESVDEFTWGGSSRELLHGCHGKRFNPKCGRKLRQCPACRFPSARNLGHCKRSKKVLNCRKGPGGQVQAFAFARAAEDVFADTAFEDSGIVRGRCPILPSAAEPGHFEELLAESELDEEPDYTESDYEYNIVLDGNSYQYYGDGDYEIRPPEFVAVATPAEFQAALRVGAFHILVKEHLDMTDAPTEPDLIGLEGLNSAVGRVLNTTRSIVGDCFHDPPGSFELTEPRPRGACAILVKEDFLDAPLGTSCLLLDSLYIAVASPAGTSSSVLILHVDGLMWITNSVFQGAGSKGRAIDTNTIDRGVPELFVSDTTIVGFTRDLAPGIRVLRGGILWLDNVSFKRLAQIPRRRPRASPDPEGTAVVAYKESVLIFVNVTLDDNTINGAPAGDQAIAIAKNPRGATAASSPRLRVWQWPGGPFTMTSAEVDETETLIMTVGRPELRDIQEVAERARL